MCVHLSFILKNKKVLIEINIFKGYIFSLYLPSCSGAGLLFQIRNECSKENYTTKIMKTTSSIIYNVGLVMLDEFNTLEVLEGKVIISLETTVDILSPQLSPILNLSLDKQKTKLSL